MIEMTFLSLLKNPPPSLHTTIKRKWWYERREPSCIDLSDCFNSNREGEEERVVAGPGVQNWEAELGSHWSSRTMEGSLLAPLMNSSRDSLPAGKTKNKITRHKVFILKSCNSCCKQKQCIFKLFSMISTSAIMQYLPLVSQGQHLRRVPPLAACWRCGTLNSACQRAMTAWGLMFILTESADLQFSILQNRNTSKVILFKLLA